MLLMNNHINKIEDRIMWTSLGVYLLTWILLHIFIMGLPYWYLGSLLGLIYVLGHVYAIKKRGHCYLSADGVAAPLSMTLSITIYVFMKLMSISVPSLEHILQAYYGSFILGHVLH